ncbi:MAG: hypothetical protein AAF512_01825 [Pseudomonadota bacterium]
MSIKENGAIVLRVAELVKEHHPDASIGEGIEQGVDLVKTLYEIELEQSIKYYPVKTGIEPPDLWFTKKRLIDARQALKVTYDKSRDSMPARDLETFDRMHGVISRILDVLDVYEADRTQDKDNDAT